jgi:hypothetical protein
MNPADLPDDLPHILVQMRFLRKITFLERALEPNEQIHDGHATNCFDWLRKKRRQDNHSYELSSFLKAPSHQTIETEKETRERQREGDAKKQAIQDKSGGGAVAAPVHSMAGRLASRMARPSGETDVGKSRFSRGRGVSRGRGGARGRMLPASDASRAVPGGGGNLQSLFGAGSRAPSASGALSRSLLGRRFAPINGCPKWAQN